MTVRERERCLRTLLKKKKFNDDLNLKVCEGANVLGVGGGGILG